MLSMDKLLEHERVLLRFCAILMEDTAFTL